MAIINTLRFRNILVNGKVAEEEPAQEFVNALDEAFEEATDELATTADVGNLGIQLRAEMAVLGAKMDQQQAELTAEIRALETTMTRRLMWVGFGIVAALAALMTLLMVFVN